MYTTDIVCCKVRYKSYTNTNMHGDENQPDLHSDVGLIGVRKAQKLAADTCKRFLLSFVGASKIRFV
jgi:glucan biosynthesis protein